MRKIEITDHSINMFSQWKREVTYRREERLSTSRIRVKVPGRRRDRLTITPRARELMAGAESDPAAGTVDAAAGKEYPAITLSEEDRQKIRILEEFLSRLLGKEVKIKIPVFVGGEGKSSEEKSDGVNGEPATRESWQIQYRLHESYEEKEELNFSSGGVVRTADGKKIKFDVELNMSREFAVENNVNLKISGGEPVDPLVINYSGRAADFKETTFKFDLTADGRDEELPQLKPGSGFLVLPEEKGKIKDGSHLFGPTTGDGFKELAEYDEDGNGWIDSADPVFNNLRIWTRDNDGKNRLFALGKKGIGAIYLGNLDASYRHKGEGNRTLAVNKKMGLYLGENGQAGTVQEVDLYIK